MMVAISLFRHFSFPKWNVTQLNFYEYLLSKMFVVSFHVRSFTISECQFFRCLFFFFLFFFLFGDPGGLNIVTLCVCETFRLKTAVLVVVF